MTTTSSSVRGEILAQHHRLRAQLATLRSEAERAMHAGPGEVPDLPATVGALLRSLEEHMAFEDRHLRPLLEGRNPFGHRYATLLFEDHERQREELAAIAAEAKDPDDVTSLALAVQAFAEDTIMDMDDEEFQFLTPHLLTGNDGADDSSRRTP
jgi:iron-sulfur cluster repair protein YtfE (RIC family)